MLKSVLSACAFAMLITPAYAQEPSTPCGIEGIAGLAGVWTGTYRTDLGDSFSTDVFGEGAYDRRDVELTIDSGGEGSLKVSSAVLNRKGDRHAPSVTEVKLELGALETWGTGWLRPSVAVAGAEKRYLDELGGVVALDGISVNLITDTSARQIDLHLVVPERRDSFGTKLMPRRRANPNNRIASSGECAERTSAR